MLTLLLTPHPALQPYIQHYVSSETGIPGQWTDSNTTPPGCTALAITREGNNLLMKVNGDAACSYESVAFSGQMVHYKKISLYGQVKSFFVIFQPWGAYRLLDLGQDECKDRFINLTDLMGLPARPFREELAAQSNVEGIRTVVEKFFLKRLSQAGRHPDSMRLAQAVDRLRSYSHQNSVIDQVCRQDGYSVSRLERHMRKIVGIGPKQFQQIARFHAVLRYLGRHKGPYNWARIAYQFGYFDQTHLIKAFKQFYGKTPGKYDADELLISDVAFRENLET